MSDESDERKSADVSYFIKENAALLHNLRTPLLTIKAYANQIVRTSDDTGDLPLNIEVQVDRINRELDKFWSGLQEEYPIEFEQGQDQQSGAQCGYPEQNKANKKQKILVVDDDEIHRDIIERLLSKEGHHVSVSTGGTNAMSLIKLTDFDVVIVDIHMPDTGGFEVAECVQGLMSENTATRIFGISSDPRIEEMSRRCMDAGMQGFIDKPITLEKLKKVIS